MTTVTPFDTRVSPTITREAALAVFPQGSRDSNPIAQLIGGTVGTVDRVRTQLVNFTDAVEAINGDETLTESARILAAVELANKTRSAVNARLDSAGVGLNSAREQLQESFESDLAAMSTGHGLTAGDALRLVLQRAGDLGGGFPGLNAVVNAAGADRDGVSTLALYRAPAWALGITGEQRILLRASIETTWSQPHVTARQTFEKAAAFLDRAAKLATEHATPSASDQATAADAAAGKSARHAATSDAGGAA